MEVLKELASDEKAYRSLTKSWFLNSPLWQALQKLATKDILLFIATDHGTIRVNQAVKVVGDKETTNTQMTELLNEEAPAKDKWWILAIVLGAAGLLALIIYLYQNGINAFGNVAP